MEQEVKIFWTGHQKILKITSTYVGSKEKLEL